MTQKINPLTIQSKSWLVNALLKLMKDKNFSSISIKEIAESAQLDRRTFYRHFNSKDELLIYYIDILSKEYFEKMSSHKELSISTVTYTYFEFWEKHMDFLNVIYKNNLQIYILNSYNQYMSKLYGILKPEISNSIKHDYKYGLAFKIGGFWNILFEWIKDDARIEPEEMAKILSDFLSHGMFI